MDVTTKPFEINALTKRLRELLRLQVQVRRTQSRRSPRYQTDFETKASCESAMELWNGLRKPGILQWSPGNHAITRSHEGISTP